ncbi:MAG: hypothetical protein ACQRW7_01990 [Caulobacterales bacterium]|uniref:hypothetical protein n=1 Tax=Glycocaulis sp. TaxID=1969725 RepID=UPI003FA15FB1
MSLKQNERAILERAGFLPGLIEAVSCEASRMKNLYLMRMDAQLPIRPMLAASIFVLLISLPRNALSVFFIVAALLFCAVLAASIWFGSRKTSGLLERAPERWAARYLAALAVKGPSRMEELEQLAGRYSSYASPDAALLAMAEAEREWRGPVRWFHDAIIVSAILIPLAMVIAVPVLQGRF